MYKAPTGPVGTLHQALRKDLQDLPTPDPTPDVAKRMAQVLREIAQAMHTAEGPRDRERRSTDPDEDGVYWRRCS
jgi:hypothetical protein